MCQYWSNWYNLPVPKTLPMMCKYWSNLCMCKYWSNLYNLPVPKTHSQWHASTDQMYVTSLSQRHSQWCASTDQIYDLLAVRTHSPWCVCSDHIYYLHAIRTHSPWCVCSDHIYYLHTIRTHSPWCVCSDHIYYLHTIRTHSPWCVCSNRIYYLRAIKTHSQWCPVSDQIYNLRALKRHCSNFEWVFVCCSFCMHLFVFQFLHASLCGVILRCSRSMTAFPATSFSCMRRCSVSLRARVCRWCSSHHGDRTKRADSSCISTTNGSSIPLVDWSPKATPLGQLVSVCLNGRNWWVCVLMGATGECVS